MYTIPETVISSENSDVIQRISIEKTVQSIPTADAGLVFLHDSIKNVLFVRSAVGFSYSEVSQMRIKPGESVAGKIFQTRNPRIYRSSAEIIQEMANLQPQNRYFFIAGRKKWCNPCSIISFPLIIGEQYLGVLDLYSFEKSILFSESDLAIVGMMVNQTLPSNASVPIQRENRISDMRSPAERKIQETIDFLKASGEKILVVDDEASIRELLREFLETKGYDVATVSGGKEAISKLETEAFHLVLLDIKMPDIDGIETLRRIKKIDENISVIMVTGVLDENLGNLSLKLGANDYVTKPFDFNYLEETIALQSFIASC
ncbi:TPA: response regulator [Candidatus Poribacteria bacterium]|nr:response regulator [Candidatus Poribacteria bacterium]